MSDRWRVIHGECLDVMRTLAPGSVDAIVTDPPYGTGAWLREKAGAGSDPTAIHRLEEWDRWDERWIAEAKRLEPRRWAIFVPTTQLAAAAAAVGEPGRLFVWVKPDPRPRFGGQPSYGIEPVMIFGATEPIGGKDWFMCQAPRTLREHPHQKPIKVMRWLVSLACPPDGLVIDPHAGSGTTGVACVLEGRRFLGIECEAEYVEIARRRIAEAAAQGNLFGEAA